MNSVLILAAVAAVAAVGGVFYALSRRPAPRRGRDDYQHALELWLEGAEDEAAAMLSRVVQDNPAAVDPYLQLGNLLRRRGDAARAAVLHRGLTVRRELPRAKKVTIGLALAEDLVALERYDEAGEVLDDVLRHASDRSVYWRTRFAQRHGQGNLAEAARSLKHAQRFCPERDRAWFQEAYAAYQLDRALFHARSGEAGPVRDRLRDVAKIPGARTRAALVRAVLAAVQGDAAQAVSVASEELLDSPHELGLFLPLLQEVLLATGQYARTVPILERACQAGSAPPSLWISLAMLYEKLDQRDKAMTLLESKAGQAGFTPDAAAPYLRVLAREAPASDFARLWDLLAKPAAPGGWVCGDCGRVDEVIRWFCPACRGFDSYRTRRRRGDREV